MTHDRAVAQSQAPAAPAPHRGRRARARIDTIGVVAVLAAIAGWAWTATHPQLTPGSVANLSGAGLRMANDGITDTRYVVTGPVDAVLILSVRNAGRWPVDVLGDVPDADPVVDDIRFAPLDPRGGMSPADVAAPGTAGIRLEPGREAQLRVRVDVGRCATPYGGSSVTIDQVVLRVRQLGLTSDAPVVLSYPLAVTGPRSSRPADCATGAMDGNPDGS